MAYSYLALNLTLVGEIRTAYEKVDYVNGMQTARTKRNFVEICRISVNVMQQPICTELSSGEYCYPCTFQIPSDAPASFELSKNLSAKAKASVCYTIKGKLHCDGFMRSSVKGYEKIFVVQDKVLSLPQCPVLRSNTHPIVKWCCWDNGVFDYKVELASSVLALHREAMFVYDAVMDSPRSVAYIEVTLRRKVNFKKRRFEDSSTVHKKVFQGKQLYRRQCIMAA